MSYAGPKHLLTKIRAAVDRDMLSAHLQQRGAS